jgi:hypothetical protein
MLAVAFEWAAHESLHISCEDGNKNLKIFTNVPFDIRILRSMKEIA